MSFWLISPNRNYQSCSIKYNFEWCRHHTPLLKNKTYPIYENLLKTSGEITKVLSCLYKIPLTSMRVDRFLCREIPRFQTPTIIPRTGPWLNPLEDIYILRMDSNIILRAFCVNINLPEGETLFCFKTDINFFYVLTTFRGGYKLERDNLLHLWVVNRQ